MASINGAIRAIRSVPPPTAWELWELGIQLLLLPLTLLPRSVGLGACSMLAATLMRPGSGYRRRVEADVPPPLARQFGGRIGRAVRNSERLLLYDRVLVLRGVIFPWTRRRLRVAGLQSIDEALRAGRGVILWVQPCVGSSISVKQALYEAGHQLAHLTRPSHGLSDQPFGMRFVNPILRRAETRFLAERIVIDDDRTIGAIRRIRALLKENRVVSITVTSTASRLDEYPFLEGVLSLPSGPIEIAASTGAALLAVFTAGSGAVASVEIGAPLPVSGTAPDAIHETQEALLAWLLGRIEEHPFDWNGWRAFIYRRAD